MFVSIMLEDILGETWGVHMDHPTQLMAIKWEQ